MIYINPLRILAALRSTVRETSEDLSAQLANKAGVARQQFINANADKTWQNPHLVEDLVQIVGRKCWYLDVKFTGSDHNIDHFRPWGRVREIDEEFTIVPGLSLPGYWWLALNWNNFRLACQHANQRRKDVTTDGGKSDFFPVYSTRAPELTPLSKIEELPLALDPCVKSDVKLLAFDKHGNPIYNSNNGMKNKLDAKRVATSIWLYHLNKSEIVTLRVKAMDQVSGLVQEAGDEFVDWDRDSATPSLVAKSRFDKKINAIETLISDDAEFAGASRCVIRAAMAKYSWVQEFFTL